MPTQMPTQQNVVHDLPAPDPKRAGGRRPIRLVGWVGMGLVLSMLPLVVAGAMTYQPGQRSFLEVLSTEELLTVAFTLSGAAAVDILIVCRENLWKFALGIVTLLMTLLTMLSYVLFKGHLTHLGEGVIVETVQLLYLSTAMLAFLCEAMSGE